MSSLSRLLGNDRRRERTQTAEKTLDGVMAEERDGTGWKSAFNETAGSFLSSQMPGLMQSLQGSRENAIQRGISTGDLGTSYEGDIYSAFQQNIANALSGMSMQGYENSRNRYVNMASGKLTGAMDEEANNRNMWGSIAGGAGSIFGGWLGGRGD